MFSFTCNRSFAANEATLLAAALQPNWPRAACVILTAPLPKPFDAAAFTASHSFTFSFFSPYDSPHRKILDWYTGDEAAQLEQKRLIENSSCLRTRERCVVFPQRNVIHGRVIKHILSSWSGRMGPTLDSTVY